MTGHFPSVDERSDGRTVIGPLAASVELAWTALSAMAGPDGSDAGAAPVVLGQPDRVDLRGLRVCVDSPADAPVSDEVADALAAVRQVLADVGATDAGRPPDWLDEARRVTEAYWERVHRSGRQVEQDLLDWDLFRRHALRQLQDVHVVITPTVPHMAPPHRGMRVKDYLFCLPASLLGAPAITVPVGRGAVHVMAKRWCDHVAVAVARTVESAVPRWRSRGGPARRDRHLSRACAARRLVRSMDGTGDAALPAEKMPCG